MVCLEAPIIEVFLNRDTNRCATAPDANDEMGFKAALKNLVGQFKRIDEQLIGGNEAFFHGPQSSIAGRYLSLLREL